MKYKLFISDLDGTFLDDSSLLTKKNMEAVKILHENKIKFVISSGRSFQSLDHYIKALNLKGSGEYGIALNGARIYQAEDFKPLYTSLLQNEIKDFIIENIKSYNVKTRIYDKEGGLFSTYESEELRTYSKIIMMPYRIINDYAKIKGGVLKILAEGENAELKKIYEHLLPIIKSKANMVFSCKTLLEFTSLEASKGNAALFLANYLNILPEEIIAIGDNYNDISMIQAAGLGAAVSNAEAEVKSTANYITKASNNEDAIMEIVNKFI